MISPFQYITRRIQSKITVATTLITGLISLFIYLYFPSQIQKQETRAIHQRAQTIAEMTAFSAAPGLFFGDEATVDDAVALAMHDDDLAYITVKDSSGHIAAHFSRQDTVRHTDYLNDTDLYQVSHSVHFEGEVLGFVDIGLSLEAVKLRVAQSKLTIARVSFVLFAFGIGIMMAISHFIASPIRSISLTAKRIAKGDLFHRADVKSNDEVGLLAASFNHMIDELETMRKRLERRQYELEVEFAVRKRYESELKEAMELAQASARAKSEFLATMSHEIRTPLNGVLGMAGFLMETNLDDEQVEFASIIRDSGNALLSIINDVLDFSKLEAGRIELEEGPVEIDACVEETLSLVSLKAAEKKLELAYIIHEGVPAVILGDATRLRQVLANLFSNAVKFTPNGEVVVEVAPAGSRTKNVSELHFSVRDSGIGIPEDRLDRLFKSFSQVDSSTTRKFGGTGLGLAISKRLVEAMGGRIWVESRPDEGTTFHFTIPARPAHPTIERYPDQDIADFSGKRVLLVDDSKTCLRVLTHYAQRLKMETFEASSGEEAIAALSSDNAFDLAIIDLEMPEMDGNELSRYFEMHFPHIPVILLVPIGAAHVSDISSSSASLYKPIKGSRFHETITRLLTPPQRMHTVLTEERAHPSGEQHVLVADPNLTSQQVTLLMLRRLGFPADTVENRPQLLAAVNRVPYDIVLVDLHVCQISDVETIREGMEKQKPAGPSVLIGMSTDHSEEQEETWKEAGMDAILKKPLHRDVLATALNLEPAV